MKAAVAHRSSIDLARFVAAFGVVVAHAYASINDWVGHLALGLFLILTAFLAVQSAQRAGGSYAFVPRARRLILPWLVWSAFYRLVDLVFSHNPDRFVPLSDPWTLLYGSAIHLWFLPFVALAMVLVAPAVQLIRGPGALGLASVGVAVLSVPLLVPHVQGWLPVPLPQWVFALPLYALGLLLGISHPMGKAWMPALAVAAMTSFAVWYSGNMPWAWTLMGSLVAFELFWRLPIRGRILPHLGQVAFGIYLLHPFFMLVVYKFMGAGVNLFLAAVLCFAMSWAATALLRRLPLMTRVL